MTSGIPLCLFYAFQVHHVQDRFMVLMQCLYSSMTMLKDNHIVSCGSIKSALSSARSICSFSQKIEVECQDVVEACEAVSNRADIVMLDNFSPAQVEEAMNTLREKFGQDLRSLIEVSGGVTEENIRAYAIDGTLRCTPLGPINTSLLFVVIQAGIGLTSFVDMAVSAHRRRYHLHQCHSSRHAACRLLDEAGPSTEVAINPH